MKGHRVKPEALSFRHALALEIDISIFKPRNFKIRILLPLFASTKSVRRLVVWQRISFTNESFKASRVS
jgi:hypothetical protein